MSRGGKKSPREEAIGALTSLTRDRPHPDKLWADIIDATDSLLAEPHVLMPLKKAMAVALMGAKPIPDATFALTIVAAIEQALELAICTHFVVSEDEGYRMFDDNEYGPISTFAAKTKTAYALGIIPKVAKDELDLLRHIRNAFAHSKEKIDFNSKAMVGACNQLAIPNHLKGPSAPVVELGEGTPKARFLTSARHLYVYLVEATDGPMRFSDHPLRAFFAEMQSA
jgi:hypothetical protein